MSKFLLSILLFTSICHAEGEDFTQLLGGDSSGKEKYVAQKAITNNYVISQIIGHPTPEQNIFINFYSAGQYDKALFSWWDAFGHTTFAESSNGKALYGYLLFKNKMPLTGLETLLSIKNPEKINTALVQWWNEVAPVTNPLWALVEAKTDVSWDSVFGVNKAIQARAMWNKAIEFGLKNESAKAAQTLSALMKFDGNPVSADLMNLTAARFLYQNGFLQPAARYYQTIPKSSDYFFEAQEEAAWAYMRLGEQQNTLAITKTLMVPEFSAVVGPESVFLHALANLKVCDYPEVIKALQHFKDFYRERAKNLSQITENQETAAILDFVRIAKQKKIAFADVGAKMKFLPRMITRDADLQKSLFVWNQLEVEAKTAGELYAASLSGGTAKVGFQAKFEYFKKSVEIRMQGARASSFNRIRDLAANEVKEISDILQKLQIVEAEVLQQISLTDRIVQATQNKKIDIKKSQSVAAGTDNLKFQADGELWFDELTNYKVEIKKGCQAAKF